MSNSPLPNPFQTLKKLGKFSYYSLVALEQQKIGLISKLPICIRMILESLLRNCDGKKVSREDIVQLAHWNPKTPSTADIPFCVARVILQDFTGVPLLVDLAAMRDAVAEKGLKPELIEPQVPVDLVIDHSVQVDRAKTADAFQFNLEVEFERNRERYEFMKWGQEAFHSFKVVPPGIGIVHQVNLEHIASVVIEREGVLFPDTLVGTDSHTTMINGLGVVGWGVGGIEAEAAMLGQPVSLQTPEVIGFCLEGELKEGVTATDLTLRITEMLRKEKVVGKFVEFFGSGTASLSVADRATIGNMAPEYGATMGFFPVDEKTLDYLRLTGRSEEQIQLIADYLKAQKLFGVPKKGEIDYTKEISLDLSTVRPCVAGPKRPQDRIPLESLKTTFQRLLKDPIPGGYGKTDADLRKMVYLHSGGCFAVQLAEDSGGTQLEADGKQSSWSEEEMWANRPFTSSVTPPGHSEQVVCEGRLSHGSIVIAAITSCTNTSNPHVMIAAGLLAKKAVEKGLQVNPLIKTSLAPGSRVVTDYLDRTGLQPYLDALGFQLVAYGCTTCIGNSGPLDSSIEEAIKTHDLIAASVLSGNRNFEARIHSSVKANFLMSPPLVVAYALAGRINIDLMTEPLGLDTQGQPVFLKDLWPSEKEIQQAISQGILPEMFTKRYAHIMTDNPTWDAIPIASTSQYTWNPSSTYIRKPPFFAEFSPQVPARPPLSHLRALALFGDSITTDHISPAGAFSSDSPAGKYLLSEHVSPADFNSYGSRRGNHEVMMRGTFANVRISNKLAEGKEGGFTKLMPEGTLMPIFDACQLYAQKNIPLIIFAGKDYGMGSSRDWAAKGTALLGVRVVVAQSFERIHRSNLIGMGVLPLAFPEGQSWESLHLTGEETFSLNAPQKILPRQQILLTIDHSSRQIPLIACIDTPTEAHYYEHGGILPFVLRQLL
ncbi:MAG: aconitate hydratase [Chlamydiales bacterium]|nr:aconitate hydratase [Chlamydiales bacterium]